MEEHEKINALIREHFESHPAWGAVQPCTAHLPATSTPPSPPASSSSSSLSGQARAGALSFFPVDNTRAQRDPVMKAVMQRVKEVAQAEEYMKRRVPFAWMKLIEEIDERRVTHRQAIMTLSDVYELGRSCGLPNPGFTLDQEVRYCLIYLSRIGLVMWFNQPGLSDLVIIVSYHHPPLSPLSFVSYSSHPHHPSLSQHHIGLISLCIVRTLTG